MKIKKVKIGIFASSPSLMGRIQALSAQRQVHIHFNTQGLDDAIPIAVEMEREGIEVAVGRRGTAHLLRENLRIPVLSFPHRSLDILISLKAAAQAGRAILFPVFRQEITGIGDPGGAPGHRARPGTTATLPAWKAITRARRQGCDVVVGGGVTQQIAKAVGLKFVEIRTSDEDIAATLDNAVSVALAGREQKAMARRYRAIIDAADGIVAVDPGGRITAANAAARKAFHIGEEEALGQPLLKFFPESPIPRC